jgi:DNA topoisomerase I
MNNLVIVESPTKARTLSKFLGRGYQIEASMGHIRDLPKSELGVDVADNFEPKYIIPRDKKKKVNELKKLAANSKTVWLASDPDREGEAIAYHLRHIINDTKGKKPEIKRVEFHEITESAIKEAFNNPREIDKELVDAQQARRVLDRLVGYKLSPILWKKIKRGLSAGRVQTVALKLIVEREKEIEAFNPVEYWSIEVVVETKSNNHPEERNSEGSNFSVTLVEINGQKIGLGESQKNLLSTQEETQRYVKELEKASYQVSRVEKKEVRRYPQAPFITSTLQQTAGNKLGFTAKKTMMIAQNLYEQGFITYMRTDSVNLSSQAISSAREFIETKFGKEYLPQTPRVFKSKSKNAQEAHEAIRPTNLKLIPDKLKGDITREHKRLYDLIWKRTMASQMSEAVLDQTTITVIARNEMTKQSSQGEEIATPDVHRGRNDEFVLKATGSVLKFDGWMKLYGIMNDESRIKEEEKEGEEAKDENQILPALVEGEGLNKKEILAEQHFTQPPPRFTEASLIKKLEELGIGRPSTYAPTISTIQDRFYVERSERKFVPTHLGLVVTDFLVKYFPDVFDYSYTAQMEEELDEISRGERKWQETIKELYDPLEGKVEQTMELAERVELPVETVDQLCPECGKPLAIKSGKFGKFLACTGFPDCKHTERLEQKVDAKCPKDGGEIVMRKTKKGRPFYGCKNYPNCDFASWTKPK